MASYVKLVVYGQLRRGGVANHLLRGKFLREVELRGFDLYLAYGKYPAAIPGNGILNGELWEVPEDNLLLLDQYEGEGDIYKRALIKVEGDPAYIYLWNRGDEMLIEWKRS